MAAAVAGRGVRGVAMDSDLAPGRRGAARRAVARVKDGKLRELTMAVAEAAVVISSLQRRLDGETCGALGEELAVRLVAHLPDLEARIAGAAGTHEARLSATWQPTRA
jgi:hypothetical protein